MRRVYLDNNATTPVSDEVLDAMLPFLKEEFGNASSIHQFGRKARVAIDEAREKVAAVIGADPNEIVFTGGGSESDNFAIKGIAYAHQGRGKHMITTQVEHPAVLGAAKYLAKQGFEVTYLGVDEHGMVDPADVAAAIRNDTTLITIIHGNNEVGTLQPIEEIAALAKAKGVVFHTDAVQSFGKVPIDVRTTPIDLISFSAHKLHGPKGVGGLYVRKKTHMHPLIAGGHQERNRRAGTENVAGIVGLGKACEVALRDTGKQVAYLKNLRDRLERGIVARIPHVKVNGHPAKRLPTTLNISFKYVEGESLVINLDLKGVAVSTGSACTSGTLEPSHVLIAMGIPAEVVHGSIRFSVGMENTEEEIDYTLEVLPPIVERMREMSPLWEGVKV